MSERINDAFTLNVFPTD